MKNFSRRILIPLLLTAIVGGVVFYVTLPALNFKSLGFWSFAQLLLLVFLALSLVLGTSLRGIADGFRKTQETHRLHIGLPTASKIAFVAFLVSLAVVIVAEVVAMPLFQSRSYAKQGAALLTTGDFAVDVPVVENGAVSDIAIMDTNTAATMGKRQIGSLGTLATQYELGGFMTTTINSQITKVAPLGYGDFWKWLNRRSEGIPGYVTVDPVTGSSSYVQLENPMFYSDTGLLNDNVARKMRFAFPTDILGNLHFEIDNDGNPYWVATAYTHKVSLFECAMPVGVVTCNAVTGQCARFDMASLPEWVSIAWPADDMIRLVNYAGLYSDGYFNSVMAKTGVFRTTDDYGYKVVGDNLNAFTGITSAASDESNIGFILCDMHTGGIVEYQVYGAEEYSAEVAAEGLVMNFGYTASFPSLVNVEGTPVYVMALTDDGNLIKKYAMVDLQDYTKVAVGDTVKETWQSFVAKYFGGAVLPEAPDASAETQKPELTGGQITVVLSAQPALADENGSTYAYLRAGNDLYRLPVTADSAVILFAGAGDTVTLTVGTAQAGAGISGGALYEAALESLIPAEVPVQADAQPEEKAEQAFPEDAAA